MTKEQDKSLDLLGLKPVADSINTITKGVVDAAGAFLGRICLPAAEEFGLLLKDKISNWRRRNALAVIKKAEEKLALGAESNLHAHPRIVSATIEYGSWTDNDMLRDMWGGLLASSCTESGDDESNLLFVTILSQLTSSEASILNYCCNHFKIRMSKGGWLHSEYVSLNSITLQEITKIIDIHRIDRELDHLRALELIEGGFSNNSKSALISIKTLGIQMFIRCQGFLGAPEEFFQVGSEQSA